MSDGLSIEQQQLELTAEAQQAFREAQERTNETWQKTILPFVRWGLISLAVIVFSVVSVAGVFILKSSIQGSAHLDPYSQVYISSISRNDSQKFDAQRAQFALAGYQSIRRHDRANMSVLTRELLRFASFMIGSALTFIGALFIVGKFTELSPTSLTAKGLKVEGSLTTSSPGIFAMSLGCIVILFALAWRHQVEVRDPQITLFPIHDFQTVSAPMSAPKPTEEEIGESCKRRPEYC